jgi:hypothetical protein
MSRIVLLGKPCARAGETNAAATTQAITILAPIMITASPVRRQSAC